MLVVVVVAAIPLRIRTINNNRVDGLFVGSPRSFGHRQWTSVLLL